MNQIGESPVRFCMALSEYSSATGSKIDFFSETTVQVTLALAERKEPSRSSCNFFDLYLAD